jgi:hypothetical protein
MALTQVTNIKASPYLAPKPVALAPTVKFGAGLAPTPGSTQAPTALSPGHGCVGGCGGASAGNVSKQIIPAGFSTLVRPRVNYLPTYSNQNEPQAVKNPPNGAEPPDPKQPAPDGSQPSAGVTAQTPVRSFIDKLKGIPWWGWALGGAALVGTTLALRD